MSIRALMHRSSSGPVRALCAAFVLTASFSSASAQIVFEPPVDSDGGNHAVRVLVGDVDGDRIPDALTAHEFFSVGDATLSRGLGGGAFGPPSSIALGEAGRELRHLADFDEDGDLDLLTIGGNVPPLNVAVLLGDGLGGFGPPLGINSNQKGPIDAEVGDFDGDDHLDVAILNEAVLFLPGDLVVVFGNGDGTFGRPVAVEASHFDGFSTEHVMRVGDTTGDGFDDITYSSSASFFTPTYVSNGDGTFTQATCGPGTCTPILDLAYELVDMNGDGRADAVTPDRILIAKPSGMFSAGQFIGSTFVPIAVGVGDFDGDGLPDVAVGRNGTFSETDPNETLGDVMVYRGLGDGTVDTAGVMVSHVAQPRWLAVADADVDGRQDIVAARFQNAGNSLSTLLNFTYAPGSAWLDLGNALPGSNGAPILLADGTLIVGEPYSVSLKNGLPNGAGKLFVGLTPLFAPFKQGVMVPRPDVFFGPVPLDATGSVSFGGAFPPGASGATIWLQWWLPESGGPVGWAASSGVRAQVP
jgi:hypothetical protein